MTEAELFAELAVRADRMWEISQWWASITFGVLLAAHLGSRHLNLKFVTIILVAYISFSFNYFQSYIFLGQANAVILESLANLASQEVLSELGSWTLANRGIGRGIPYVMAVLASFIGTLYYVIYAYRNRERD